MAIFGLLVAIWALAKIQSLETIYVKMTTLRTSTPVRMGFDIEKWSAVLLVVDVWKCKGEEFRF